MSTRLSTLVPLLLAIVGSGIGSGCNDPVPDAQIDALGPEKGTPGPDHRPGQPCVLCHSDGGPASDQPFAIAGTVYKNSKAGSDGASGITVQFVDATGGAPIQPPTTTDSGNFYVPLSTWPDIAFPIRVALYDQSDLNKPLQTMQSNIGREQSCNFCHQPNPDPSSITDAQVQASAASAGQVYLNVN